MGDLISLNFSRAAPGPDWLVYNIWDYILINLGRNNKKFVIKTGFRPWSRHTLGRHTMKMLEGTLGFHQIRV